MYRDCLPNILQFQLLFLFPYPFLKLLHLDFWFPMILQVDKSSRKIGLLLRQNRVYRDKKEKSEQEVSKKQKKQVNPCFFYSKQAVIIPRGQNAYQRDRGLQEQTKNSI